MPAPSSPPPRRRGPGPVAGLVAWLWRPLLILLVAGALGWWMWGLPTRERAAREPPPPDTSAPASAPAPLRRWRPREIRPPAPGCAPEADRRCLEGDAWWIDGCGAIYAKAEECGARLCRAGECEPPPPPGCGDVPLLGRCDGDVARGCEAGHPFEIDCAAWDRRCVLTEEGPSCRERSPDACDPLAEPPRCEGVELVTCFEGERQRVDCRAHAAVCGQPPGGGDAACLRWQPPVQDEGCDEACGCPPPADDEEICDGLDNDGDGWVDESGTCPPVDLVFIVVTDERGEGSYAREDVDRELARMQRWFSRDDYGIELRLADVVRWARSEWLELDDDDLQPLVRSTTALRPQDELYVPIVLTDRVLVDGIPRPGLSTVPNGSCGGQRRVAGRQPVLGLVALAKRRWDSTGAHELGHFFGLCHTHADHPQLVLPLDPGPSDRAEDDRTCVEPCTVDGDGICDTPIDPGPAGCTLDAECNARCSDGSEPDPGNLMGYYPECRAGFSEQQMLLMRRMIALRRGWHRCRLGDGCPCEIGAGDCPEGMGCRRFTGDEGPYRQCALEGPVVPGGVCTGSINCAANSQCIGRPDGEPRCVRPCTDETSGCRCAEVGGVTHPICIDDLRYDSP